MFIATEWFLSYIVKEEYDKHPNPIVPTDDGGSTWYPLQACQFLELELNLHIHYPYEKSIIERTIQYIKDMVESFDDLIIFLVKRRKVNSSV